MSEPANHLSHMTDAYARSMGFDDGAGMREAIRRLRFRLDHGHWDAGPNATESKEAEATRAALRGR